MTHQHHDLDYKSIGIIRYLLNKIKKTFQYDDASG